ncbi:MAG TPA: mannosyltransferase family protein [Dictyobacter sp.]|jgi:Gpi18-like mannosyltransferase|nr:mannosyltransferase family protein [Dictyobacter sp.]
MKRPPIWDIIGLFLITRISLIAVTYFGYIFLTQAQYSGAPVPFSTFLQAWNNWDATVYIRIAKVGYQSHTDLAFFPLFSLLIAIIGRPFGPDNYLAIGMIISNVALLGLLFVLYQLAVDSGGELVGRRTILYLCIFPTAFFFFSAYNESLYILLMTGSFLALRKQYWWLAGLLGGLAAFTRNGGILLMAPYLWELWLAREQLFHSFWKLTRALLPILLIPAGLAIYAYYCWSQTGNPLYFASIQYHWSREFSWPWAAIWQAFFELFWNQPFGSFFQVHVLLDLSATLGFIVLLIIGYKKLRFSYTLWATLLMLSILFSSSLLQHDPLISNQRFVLEMFPGFITLAMLSANRPRLHEMIKWAFPILLATLSLLFVMGKWMV